MSIFFDMIKNWFIVKTKLLHSLGSLFGLLLFTLALWVLYHELKAYHLLDIIHHVKEIPSRRFLLALFLTILSYSIMTGYDTLALRYIQHPLPYGKTALASFISYAFSNNIGLSMLAGGSVRYRLYSAWGLAPLEITKVIAFCSLTFWLGFLTLAGLVFLMEPLAIPMALHPPFATVRPLGVIFLVFVGSYLLLGFLRKRPLKIRGLAFSIPSSELFLAQMAVALLDCTLAGSALYALLPVSSSLSYPGFLGIYLLAQMAGMTSQVPGGVGIFETVTLLLLSPTLPASAAFGSLLAFRGIYYILPLLAAAVLLGTQEIFRKKEDAR